MFQYCITYSKTTQVDVRLISWRLCERRVDISLTFARVVLLFGMLQIIATMFVYLSVKTRLVMQCLHRHQ